jgi:hypothetical protein
MINRAGEILEGRKTYPVRVQDISRGGAATVVGVELPMDATVSLRIDGLNGTVAGRILRRVGDKTTIQFSDDATAWIDAIQARQAA